MIPRKITQIDNELVSNTLLVATGPTGFAGAGQILAQTLRELSKMGCRVVFVGREVPFPLRFLDGIEIDVEIIADPHSGAIGNGRAIKSQDVLFSYGIAEKISNVVLDFAPEQYRNTIIWGNYLIPYGYGALMANEILNDSGRPTSLWLTPTGSDIWEVGPQLFNVTRQLLLSPKVDEVFSYTAQFAKEILERYSLGRSVDCISPMLDLIRFHPVAEETKLTLRRSMGISRSSFVISSHSNMRPIKHPEDVVHIANVVASNLNRKVVLLMIGPEQELEIPQATDNLSVIWLGVVHDVERYLWASDVELNCSSHDSFNLSLAEAMACGLPCVSTDVVGIAPEIRKSNGGYLFQYVSRQNKTNLGSRYTDVVEHILLLARREELRQESGANASRHAFSVFKPDRILPKYISMISSVDASNLNGII